MEPYVRRYWLQVLIAWTRVLFGKFRDPIVGGQILVGIAAGLAICLADAVAAHFTGIPSGGNLLESRRVISLLFRGFAIPPAIALSFLLLSVLVRRVVRKTWLAATVGALLIAALQMGGGSGGVFASLQAVVLIIVGFHFGLLAMAIVPFAGAIRNMALTPNLSAWYAPAGWIGVIFFLALALLSFRNALGGRKVLRPDLFDG